MENKGDIQYRYLAPQVEQFIQLRADCGWGLISERQAKLALANSLIHATAVDGNRTIGFGRVIGDGALNYYIQDLIVDAAYRNHNIGSILMEMLMVQIKASNFQDRYTVGLMSALGKQAFYEQFGFSSRPSDRFGPGMTLDVECWR